jgi:uncharacterized repeat protein (TIGR03843 family)
MDITSINPDNNSNFKLVINILQFGKIEVIGQPLIGSNDTLFVKTTFGQESLHAIYKPERGEQPLWDFPLNSLSKREISAFIISHLIGWNFVPPTIYTTSSAPFGNGSLQLFIPHNPRITFFNLLNRDIRTIQKIAIFDTIINNADRKGGHIIQDENGKIWLIDHGLCFHTDYKLRTVIWDFADQTIPDELLEEMQRFHNIIKNEKFFLVQKLKKLLSSVEFFMVVKRTDELLRAGTFPAIGNRESRPYPWPLI